MKNRTSRRQFVKGATAGMGLLTLPSFASAPDQDSKKKKVLCVGGHPDDPESGCGGTLAKLSRAGHDVTIVYLTRGEAGISGKSHSESASIRTKEPEAACKILNVKSVFAGQIDGDTVINNEWFKTVGTLVNDLQPDVVFTHWPVDAHKDHQAASILTIQAWMNAAKKFDLYFFEACLGEQTMAFRPTDYVDITDVQEIKKKSVFCHVSQDPSSIYTCGHSIMEEFRGREMGVKAAEAFVRVNGNALGF